LHGLDGEDQLEDVGDDAVATIVITVIPIVGRRVAVLRPGHAGPDQGGQHQQGYA
jgi:hypothetical protein